LFANDPNLGLITLPLLIYHPTQLFSGSVMVPYIARWYKANPDPTLPEQSPLQELARISALTPQTDAAPDISHSQPTATEPAAQPAAASEQPASNDSTH
jgi:hypothetical protein